MISSFPKLFASALIPEDETSDMTNEVSQFVTETRCKVYFDDMSSNCVVIECDDSLRGCIIGCTNVQKFVHDIKEVYTKYANNWISSDLLIAKKLPDFIDEVQQFESVISIVVTKEVLFTKVLKNALKTIRMVMKNCNSVCCMIDKNCELLLRQFLKEVGFSEVASGDDFGFCLMAWNRMEQL